MGLAQVHPYPQWQASPPQAPPRFQIPGVEGDETKQDCSLQVSFMGAPCFKSRYNSLFPGRKGYKGQSSSKPTNLLEPTQPDPSN
ncbi:hypothetical protein C2845_PM15G04080 [Panicum miliaceum]|uniref:Uncharacterized protein n=1 Tax=Panicum miliaceum TaxID=4540 RepID=A0A3L6QAG4_PANMI|nr:hypothetical protein C2845_PM15G04080 [Panicum miliaceum]